MEILGESKRRMKLDQEQLQVVPLHQPGKIFRLLVAELKHNFDLAIREHTHIRRVFFGEEPVQALALLERCPRYLPGRTGVL
jgi:hypothetical protein